MARHNSGPRIAWNSHGYAELRWTDGNGVSRRQSLKTSDPIKAEQELLNFKASYSGELVTRKPLTVKEAFAIYVIAKDGIPSIGGIKRTRDLAMPFMGHLLVQDVRPEHFLKYKQYYEGQGRAYSSVYTDSLIIRAAINYVYKTRRVPFGTERPVFPEYWPEPEPRDNFISIAEFDQWIEFLYSQKPNHLKHRLGRMELFSWIAFEAGTRSRNIERLEWSMVDLDRRVIYFSRILPIQPNKKRTDVYISDALYPILKRAYEERTTKFVMTSDKRCGSQFGRAMERYLEIYPDRKDFSRHDMRRSFGSVTLDNGGESMAIANVMGISMKTFARHYGKLTEKLKRDIVNLKGRKTVRKVSAA